jgi:acyl carrier protein
MNREEVETTLIRLAAEQVNVKVETVSVASHFRNDLEFDSLDDVEYAMKVEDAFGIRVEDEKIEGLHTVGDVVELVMGMVPSPAGRGEG